RRTRRGRASSRGCATAGARSRAAPLGRFRHVPRTGARGRSGGGNRLGWQGRGSTHARVTAAMDASSCCPSPVTSAVRIASGARVAAYAEVSPSAVVNWRRGAQPKPESLRKLARALGEPYQEMARAAGYFEGAGDAPPVSAAGDEFERLLERRGVPSARRIRT